eukprot:5724336-Alexandrium_andersonii.AAC.1
MSASLVGSEMCIRDRPEGAAGEALVGDVLEDTGAWCLQRAGIQTLGLHGNALSPMPFRFGRLHRA